MALLTGLKETKTLQRRKSSEHKDCKESNLRQKEWRANGECSLTTFLYHVVNLSWNGLGAESGKLIADLIASCPNLLELYFSHNRYACCALLSHLIQNAFFCRLPFQSCLPIAKALKDNKTLLRLDLSHNPLTVAGLSSLFESLKYNTTIEWMNLQATGTFTKVSERSFSSNLFRFGSSGLVSVAPIFHSYFILFLGWIHLQISTRKTGRRQESGVERGARCHVRTLRGCYSPCRCWRVRRWAARNNGRRWYWSHHQHHINHWIPLMLCCVHCR